MSVGVDPRLAFVEFEGKIPDDIQAGKTLAIAQIHNRANEGFDPKDKKRPFPEFTHRVLFFDGSKRHVFASYLVKGYEYAIDLAKAKGFLVSQRSDEAQIADKLRRYRSR